MGHPDFLKLTDAQKAQFKDLHLQLVKEAKPLKDELRELNAHHQTLVTAEEANINAIYGSIEKIGQVKIKLAKIQANYHQKARALLTEEQRISFDQRHGIRH
jgi:Spy/CpxP family protein refolding chaperone